VLGSGKTLAVLGSFLPGSTTGTFSVGSGVSLDLSASAGSTFQLTDPAFAAGTYDLLSGSGSVLLGGPLTLAFTNGPYANGTNVVRLFTSTVTLSGSFSSVTATGLDPNQSVVFDATTGYVTVVPEPTTLAAIGTAMVVLVVRRRRKR
jgi:hypothetical protein